MFGGTAKHSYQSREYQFPFAQPSGLDWQLTVVSTLERASLVPFHTVNQLSAWISDYARNGFPGQRDTQKPTWPPPKGRFAEEIAQGRVCKSNVCCFAVVSR